MTVMKNDAGKNENASQRAVALVLKAVEVMRRTECAPDSPVNTFLTADVRREYRRTARRLREQKTQPRYRISTPPRSLRTSLNGPFNHGAAT